MTSKQNTVFQFGRLMPGPRTRLRKGLVTVLSLAMTQWVIGSTTAQAVDEFDPRAQASIEKAVAYLYENMLQGVEGRDSIAAYAMMKAGESEENPQIAEVIQRIRSRASGSNYNPNLKEPRFEVYIASVDLMTLVEADPGKYQDEIRNIVAFIRSRQNNDGSFSYPQGAEGASEGGDTSITQYAALALWGATQAGIDVDPEIFDRIAAWSLSTQMSNGAFAYHPAHNPVPLHSMTVGGLQTLLIARMHLYPTTYAGDPEEVDKQGETSKDTASDTPKKPDNKFSVIEKIDLDEEAAKSISRGRKRHFKAHAPRQHNYKPKITLAQFNAALEAGQKWLEDQYTATSPTGWKWYYFYGLERYAALAGLDQIDGHDWYGEGIAEVVKGQSDNGSWTVTNAVSSQLAETAFCILFLTKATAKVFRPIKDPTMVGTGLLVGGRGLPDNLDQLEMKNGQAGVKKSLGEIDDLLKALENPQLADVESTQADLVETIQLGDREKLIEQKDRLLKLIEHPNEEVRRTALWAMGRTGDVRMAPSILKTLEENNVDILVEANNALCWLSRRPRGVGLPDTPFDQLDESATDEEKKAAVEAWKKTAQERWLNWYQKVQPYEDRDTIGGVSSTINRLSR